MRFSFLLLTGALFLAGCAGAPPLAKFGNDGKPQHRVYRILGKDASRVQFRMLDSVNALRQASNLRPVKMDALLIAAAATHSRDMAAQNRPWHFGSDGSSPTGRVWRTGYRQTMLGENIAETFETETETLAAWMQNPASREVILNPAAQHIGFSWFQGRGGKIWWTLIMGGGPRPAQPAMKPLSNIPSVSPEDVLQG